MAGQTVTFAPEDDAGADEIPTTYEALAADVRLGARILLDDGLLSLEVTGIRDGRVDAVVHYGGELKSHKGMNLPGIEVSAPALTEKDLEDVAQAAALGVDYVALSFVRRPEDIEQLRMLVPRSTKLVAKIEKDTALRNLCGILDASDAIMVARGDLGVELPFEEVPLMQKQIIREASLHGKPVITATQMLESMVHAPRPTRAEASDVANAILDGTDAVMLSAETAVGDYPLEAVRAMDRIAREMELQRQGRGVTIDAVLGRRTGDGQGLPHAPRRAERADPHRGRHRGRGLRRGRDAQRAAHRLLHQQRVHRAEGVHLPPHRADLRLHARAGHLPPALHGLGRDAGAHRALHRLRHDARRRAAADSRARAGPAGRAARGDRGRSVRHARALPTSSRSKQFRGCGSLFWARARRSACPRSAAAARSAGRPIRGTSGPGRGRWSRRAGPRS